jgi:hypothetical protein
MSRSFALARLIWTRSAYLHTGPRRVNVAVYEAGHTTAPDRVFQICLKNNLHQRGGIHTRTYDRKRSDQKAAQNPCEEEAVHIWGLGADRHDNSLKFIGQVGARSDAAPHPVQQKLVLCRCQSRGHKGQTHQLGRRTKSWHG